MKLDKLQQKLIAAARKDIPSDAVPYAFEKRVMAGLANAGSPDGWILWSRALWKATVPCLALLALAAVWSARIQATQEIDFALQFEETVLAELNYNLENEW